VRADAWSPGTQRRPFRYPGLGGFGLRAPWSICSPSSRSSLCRIQGIVEQYTNPGSGWDYYQLVTTKTADFLDTQPADLNGDCNVDLIDFRVSPKTG